MRYSNYIIENDVVGNIFDDLIENGIDTDDIYRFITKCNGRPVYRGIMKRIDDYVIMKSRLNDRAPMDTSKASHDILNKLFKNAFGWNVRNGVFASGNIAYADAYGGEYYFYPLGRYEYVWSPRISDLTNEWIAYNIGDEIMLKSAYNVKQRYMWGTDFINKKKVEFDYSSFDNYLKSIYKCLEDTIIGSYIDDRLVDAIKSNNEISFKCDKYVLSYYNLAEI